jgi:hypothetical protein
MGITNMASASKIPALIFVLLLTSCLFGGSSHRRTPEGPGAINDWREKYRERYKREPSPIEVSIQEGKFKTEVENYIAKNSNLDERKKSQLRNLTTYPGMTKTEVKLFLNAPVRIVRDSREMAKLAEKFWSELQGRVDEAWMYEPHVFFFQGDTLVDIHEDVAAQPL